MAIWLVYGAFALFLAAIGLLIYQDYRKQRHGRHVH